MMQKRTDTDWGRRGLIKNDAEEDCKKKPETEEDKTD